MAVVKTDDMLMQARGFYGLPLLRQLGLMAGLAASVAIGVAVVLWSQQPDYRMLYSNLADQDSAAVTAALDDAGIRYTLSNGASTIMVPGNRVHDARLKLAGEGLPRGAGSGFELLEEKQGFGTSQFMENARYQRALEGELAKTIAALNTVRTARVHVAIPRESAFARNQRKPSASVTIDLYPGRNLNDGQAAAISHMVAASIPNLEVDDVTIIDQNGRLLTSGDADEDMRMTATQFDYRKRVEDHYIRRIEDILTPITGRGAVRAQVNADIDYTVTQETRELFNPDQRAVRSEQIVEEHFGNRHNFAGGVPGSLSNQPPVLDESLENDGETRADGNSTRRDVRNFEIDKTISHSRMNGGVLQRLSAAVVVDHRQTVNEDGESVSAPLSDDEIERLTRLVQEAIGFSAERGDSVNVVNAAFNLAEEPEMETVQESALAGFDIASFLKQLVAIAVVAFLIFGVLRPVLRELAARGKSAPVAALPAGGDQGLAEDQISLGNDGQRPALPRAQQGFQQNREAARSLASQDPKRVAQVVRNWVTSE